MKINAIGADYSAIRARNAKSVKAVENSKISNVQNIVTLSFKGNPSKHPNQIAGFATESNYLGGIYCAGGLGDVAEALPDSIANHAKEVIGKDVDMRTFHPYYSFDDSEGRIYVAKKEAVEKFNKGEPLVRGEDFILVDQNYKLKEGESFALITQTEGQGGQKIKKMHLLKDTGLSGSVERVAKDNFNMETIPYRIFEVDTHGARKDRMYIIHTPEMASGKSAYGIYSKYVDKTPNGTKAYGGTTAYGGSKAYGGGAVPQKGEKFFSGRAAGDMFFTEQIRAMEKALEKMDNNAHGNFNPQNIMLHDRFAYSMLTDATQYMSEGNKYWNGIKYVPIFHNPGRTYQGCFANPVDFFKIVATKTDLDKLKANENYNKVNEISEKIAKGNATTEECTQLYNFFEPYFKKYIDSEGCFNMTKIAIATADEYSGNCSPGNVSRYYGKETRDFATEDIAKGLTQDLINIKDKTIDVVNGAKPANMASNKQDGFFGTGTLNNIFKDVKDVRKYTPFAISDSVDKIYSAKKSNKTNLINIIADATSKSDSDSDAVAKVFFSDSVISGNRGKDAGLKLTLGGLSPANEKDVLFLSWGRPDPQKGLKVTARAFRKFLQDETVPLETRLHSKLLFGAGKDVFRDGNKEWEGIKEEMQKIAEIEVNGKKGIFKGNACYVNGLFPNRLANCTDASIFTSRWEPCGITPFESFATGTPVINIKSGGAPDFITPGKTGLLTNDPFMLSASKLGLDKNVSYDVLDEARVEHSAKDTANMIKEFLKPVEDGTFETKQKQYIENCLKEKIEWHNNNAYNGGKSALEVYLKDKFNTTDNNVATEIKSSGRGDFNNDAFKASKTKGSGKSLWNTIKKHKTAAIIAGSALGLVGLGYAGYKAGWLSPRFEEEKKNGHLSCVG